MQMDARHYLSSAPTGDKNEWQHKHGQYNSKVGECSQLTD